MDDAPLYSDGLVTLGNDAIVFHRYYLPTYRGKVVPLSDIVDIVSEKPTFWNGKWRLHGSGAFNGGMAWFPLDFKRFRRKKIFFATLDSQRIYIGFTVENADQFEKALRNVKLLVG